MPYDVVDDYIHIAARLPDVTSSQLGILCLAQAVNHLAYQLRELGNGNASTQMGAIENLAKELREGLDSLTGAITALPL